MVKRILRQGSLRNPARNAVKSRAKIGPALFRCECGECGYAVYEGTSEKNFEALKEEFSDLWLLMEKGHVDHIVPIREGKREEDLDWTQYIHDLFCEIDNLQYLAKPCHKDKSERDKNG